MLHFIGGQIVGLAVGFLIGCFAPAIGRKVKSWFVKQTQAIEHKLPGH